MWEKITAEQYIQMKETDIRLVDPATVLDIQDIQVDPKLSSAKRIRAAARQMNGNTFLYRCGGILVKTSFAGTRPLQAVLEEQKQVWQVIGELQSLIDDGEQEVHNLRQFLKRVRKYTDPKELTAEMLNELAGKIIVHAPNKSSRHRRQKVEIYYKAAGIIDIVDDLCGAGDGRGQWRKERKTA